MKKLTFGLQGHSYPYYVAGGYEPVLPLLDELEPDKVLVCADSDLPDAIVDGLAEVLEDASFDARVIRHRFSESEKGIPTLCSVLDHFVDHRLTRRSLVGALGGGTCGNVTGLAASLFFRGTGLVHFPTNLMAAADSVLSLKQAINYRNGKNMVGTYHRPSFVFTNTAAFSTMQGPHVVSGLCEFVKNLLVLVPEEIPESRARFAPGRDYGDAIYRYVIESSLRAKARVMADDQYEKRSAVILEYGHTVGHSLELLSSGRLLHGHCVGFGMLCAARVANALGILSDDDLESHFELLAMIGWSLDLDRGEMDAVVEGLRMDNKRGYIQCRDDEVALLLLKGLGRPLLNERGGLLHSIDRRLVERSVYEILDRLEESREPQTAYGGR